MNKQLWQQHFPEFAACNDAVIKQLMESSVLVNLQPQQQVFYPGKPCENYLLVIQGSVKAQIMSADGREIVLYHVHPGDTCILTTSCLLGNNDYPAEGLTETEVSAFAIPAYIFHRCLNHSGLFREFVFKHFSKRLSDVIKRMESIVFGTIDQKLARSLLDVGSLTIHKTHHELALEMGTAREVVSRHLKRFESCGWLILSRRCIEITNLNALKEITDLNQAD